MGVGVADCVGVGVGDAVGLVLAWGSVKVWMLGLLWAAAFQELTNNCRLEMLNLHYLYIGHTLFLAIAALKSPSCR